MTVLARLAPTIISASALSILAACGTKEVEDPPHFALEQCTRISLIDGGTGQEIAGAEDLDFDRAGERLFVSAYDRRAVERAEKKGQDKIPEGGLYVVSLSALSGGETNLRADPITASAQIAGGFRPHGIAFDEARGQLHVINRSYIREKKRWRMQARLLSFDSLGELIAARDAACSANDLTVHEGRLLVTLDHGGCGFRAGVEDVFGLKQARVVDVEGATVAEGLGFANGAASLPDGRIIIAATREHALYPFSFSGGAAGKQDAFPLGAAPDNLSISDEGRVVAAVHPSLLAIGLQRRLGIGRSPSRIVEIDPANGERRTLFEDAKASTISAATVAISTKGLLIIGSVIDPGIIVCRSAL